MRILCFAVLFLHTSGTSFAQKDQRLDSLKKSLPLNWILAQNDSEIVITRRDSVWQLWDMRTNAPARHKETEQEYAARIKKYGKKVLPSFTYRSEPRWTAEKSKSISQGNAARDGAIAKLPAKYGIEGIRDKFLSSKGHDYFVPVTKQDSINIAAYEKEKERLEKENSALPEFETSNRSLFKKRVVGRESETNAVWPFEASAEMAAIERKLREILYVTNE